MFAGPVCRFELVRIARRRLFYTLRFGFGLILLAIVGVDYWFLSGWDWPWSNPSIPLLSVHELAEFGRWLFRSIFVAEAALVLILTPALVADAIASERHGKTLHFLLASRLGSGEIVLGKLGARLTQLGAFLLLVLPIQSLLTLVGGVDPVEVLLDYAGLASTAFFLAAIAMLTSVEARRPRDAVTVAYVLTLTWLLLPKLILAVVSGPLEPWATIANWVTLLDSWVWPANPLGLLIEGMANLRGSAPGPLLPLAGMIGSQLVYGAVFVTLAVWQLRPAFRRHEGFARTGRLSHLLSRRWMRRRPCGDDPVYWKEAYFARSVGGLLRRVARLALPVLMVCVFIGAVDQSRPAFRELWKSGYGSRDSDTAYGEITAFNLALRFEGTALVGFWMIWLGGRMAAGITSEREQDTWTSLLATTLTGAEILRGKILGGIRSSAPIGATIVALWLLGLAAGSVHPSGLVAALVMLASSIWYVTALGTYISMRSSSTLRARALTLGIIIFPQLCFVIPTPITIVWLSLLSYEDIRSFTNHVWLASELREGSLFMAYVIGGVVLYPTAAALLTRSLFRRFDRHVDRPRRSPMRPAILRTKESTLEKTDVGEIA